MSATHLAGQRQDWHEPKNKKCADEKFEDFTVYRIAFTLNRWRGLCAAVTSISEP